MNEKERPSPVFFKLMIIQRNDNGDIIGKRIVYRDYMTLDAAKTAAKEYRFSSRTGCEVRKYEIQKPVKISFDENDTGEIVFSI